VVWRKAAVTKRGARQAFEKTADQPRKRHSSQSIGKASQTTVEKKAAVESKPAVKSKPTVEKKSIDITKSSDAPSKTKPEQLKAEPDYDSELEEDRAWLGPAGCVTEKPLTEKDRKILAGLRAATSSEDDKAKARQSPDGGDAETVPTKVSSSQTSQEHEPVVSSSEIKKEKRKPTDDDVPTPETKKVDRKIAEPRVRLPMSIHSVPELTETQMRPATPTTADVDAKVIDSVPAPPLPSPPAASTHVDAIDIDAVLGPAPLAPATLPIDPGVDRPGPDDHDNEL
jgi:hypothetical protein